MCQYQASYTPPYTQTVLRVMTPHYRGLHSMSWPTKGLVHTSVHTGSLESGTSSSKLALHLLGQLPGWGQHNASRGSGLVSASHQLLHHRQCKCKCLARASPGSPYQITPCRSKMHHWTMTSCRFLGHRAFDNVQDLLPAMRA